MCVCVFKVGGGGGGGESSYLIYLSTFLDQSKRSIRFLHISTPSTCHASQDAQSFKCETALLVFCVFTSWCDLSCRPISSQIRHGRLVLPRVSLDLRPCFPPVECPRVRRFCHTCYDGFGPSLSLILMDALMEHEEGGATR